MQSALLLSGRDDERFYAEMWDAVKNAGRWQGEAWSRQQNGDDHARWLTIGAVRNDRGEVTSHVAIFSDASERKAQAARIG